MRVLRKLSYIHSTFDNDIYVIIHPRTSRNRCVLKKTTMTTNMLIWVVEVSREGYKIVKYLPKNQHILRKLLMNFENWCNW